MSLWTTIKDVLGLTPPIIPGPPPPFTITRKAMRELQLLGEESLRLRTQATERGREVLLDRVASAGEPLVVDPCEREHLAGIFLEHDGSDFVLGTRIDVRPSTTPNPDVRLYETSRFLAEGRPFHAETPEAPGLAGHLMAVPGVASLLLRDSVVSIEKDAAASWSTLDRAIPAALRDWFVHCGQPLSATDAGGEVDPAWSEVMRVMSETVLPFVHGHGGDIRLVDVKDGVVTVQLFGACATCPASMLTLKGGVQRQLREQLPDIVERVEAVNA